MALDETKQTGQLKTTTMIPKPKIYSYIRFSTKEQLKGDSQRRQEEAIEKYKNEERLEFDTTLNLNDLGYSAYHAEHIEKGALGLFLNLVKEGRIAIGSVLLIENIDRLSRQKPTKAYDVFRGIIGAGIKIVTLHNMTEYTEETINSNPGLLFMLIGEIFRAYDESATKSRRLKSAWTNKRIKATENNTPLTGRCPLWLELNKKTNSYVRIPERCKAVELIFLKKLEGKSKLSIVKELNCDASVWKPLKSTDENKSRNKTGGWRESYVQNILTNREVIGEYQPHIKENGKRVPFGEPIPNLLPKAFEDTDLFYRVQKLLETRSKIAGHAGGKKGKANNLFTNIAKCGYCGSALHLVDKGKGPKGGKQLHCDASKRQLENREVCIAKPINYKEFVRIFFENMEELNISKHFPENDALNDQITKNESRIQGALGEIKVIEDRMFNLVGRMADIAPKPDDPYNKAYKILQIKQSKLQEEIVELKEVNKQLFTQRQELQSKVDTIKEVKELVAKALNEEEQISLRLRIHSAIFDLVERIKVYPLQKLDKERELKMLDAKEAILNASEPKSKFFGHI